MHLVSVLAAYLLHAAPTNAPATPTPVAAEPRPLLAFFEPLDADTHSDRSSGLFLRVGGGLVSTQDSSGPNDEDVQFDQGYLLSVGIGERIGALSNGLGFAVELEGLYTDQDADNRGTLQAVSDITVAAAMLNGIVDFRLADRLSIYAGAGIGVAWLDIGTKSDGLNDFNDEDGPFLAWQAKAGLAWRFTGNLAAYLGYRFLNIDDAEIDDGIGDASFDLETRQHVLETGLIFGF